MADDRPPLPAGWSYDPPAAPKTAAPEGRPALPAGWSYDPPAPAEESSWAGFRPPTNVREGLQQIMKKAAPVVGGMLESAGKTSHGLLTGELEPTPENVLPAAAAVINPVARGAAAAAREAAVAARAATKAAGGAEVEAAAQAMPRFTETPGKQAAAEVLAGVPFVGKPIREAASKSLGEFEGRVATADKAVEDLWAKAETAATRPTGAIPSQTRAGQLIMQGVRDEKPFMTPRGTVTGVGEEIKYLHPSLENVLRGAPENAIAKVIGMAKSTDPATVGALASFRKNINAADWQEIKGAAFAKLGETRAYEAGKIMPSSTTFDPMVALGKYETELSEAGRRIIFGGPKDQFRVHLDSLVADKKKMDAISATLQAQAQDPRYEALRRITQGSTLGGKVEMGAAAAAALVHPMAALAAVVGGRVAANMLAKPHTANALAMWSKAYVRFFESGGAPAALASLKIATNNLRNTAGVDIDADKLVAAMQGGGGGNAPLTQKVSDEWIEGMSPMLGHVAGAAPKNWNWRSMRESQNVERRPQEGATESQRLTSPGKLLPRINLETPEERAQWARYDPALVQWIRDNYAQEYRTRPPAGPLSRQAGLADLEKQSGSRAEPGPLIPDLLPPQPPRRQLPPTPRAKPGTREARR